MTDVKQNLLVQRRFQRLLKSDEKNTKKKRWTKRSILLNYKNSVSIGFDNDIKITQISVFLVFYYLCHSEFI